MSERWLRLESYAKWKQNRMPLCNFPGDVLEKICKYLDVTDACSFVDAIAGGRLTPHAPTHLPLVHRELLPFWIICSTRKEVDNFIRSISAQCFFMATQCTVVRMFIDWTPFKNKIPPRAVAEFRWIGRERDKMEAHTCTHHEEVLRSIFCAYRKRRPMGYVTLHKCYEFYDVIHMDARPAFMTSVPLIPTAVVPSCANRVRLHRELRQACIC